MQLLIQSSPEPQSDFYDLKVNCLHIISHALTKNILLLPLKLVLSHLISGSLLHSQVAKLLSSRKKMIDCYH